MNYALSVRSRRPRDSDELVFLTVTGPFRLPLSSEDLRNLETAAYQMPFTPLKDRDAEFIVTLPDLILTSGQAERIDAAIFKGLIERGKNGSWSRLSHYPPAPGS